MSARSLPIIDLEDLDVDALRQVTHEIGFFYLTGHGIPVVAGPLTADDIGNNQEQPDAYPGMVKVVPNNRDQAAALASYHHDLVDPARTLLVEDLTTDGRSKVNFCKALRDAGAIVEHVLVMFYYDIFPESKKIIADINVRLMYLATWWDVLRVVKQGGYFERSVIDEVERFLNAPAQWSAEHGGVSSFPES